MGSASASDTPEVPSSDPCSSASSPLVSPSDDCSWSDEGTVSADLGSGFAGFYGSFSAREYVSPINNVQKLPSFPASQQVELVS